MSNVFKNPQKKDLDPDQILYPILDLDPDPILAVKNDLDPDPILSSDSLPDLGIPT